MHTKKDTVYIAENFMNWHDNDAFRILEKRFIQDSWKPLASNKIPPIAPFLSNIDLDILQVVAQYSDRSKVDLGKLKPLFIAITEKDFSDKDTTYLKFTEPLFNASKNWALVYTYAVMPSYVGNSGYLLICRKIGSKWVVYHEIVLWIN